MASALGEQEDAKKWLQLLDSQIYWFRKNWGQCGNRLGCSEGVVSFSDAMAPSPYFDDSWAQLQADSFLLDNINGYYPPNASFGMPCRALGSSAHKCRSLHQRFAHDISTLCSRYLCWYVQAPCCLLSR